jgi:hypothetical protein
MVKVSNHKSPRNPTWERDCVSKKSKEHPLNEMTTAGVAGRLTWRFRASGRYPRLTDGLEFFLFSPVESAVGMPACAKPLGRYTSAGRKITSGKL